MSRALQALKIREIGEALEAAGLLTIQDKATALGLSRSTTWAVLQVLLQEFRIIGDAR